VERSDTQPTFAKGVNGMYHQAFSGYRGYDFNDVIRLGSNEDFERTKILAKDRLSKTFSIRDAGKLLDDAEIECLDIFGDLSQYKNLLLELIGHQRKLKYLAIHPSLVGMLDAFTLSDVLETIDVIGGTGNAYIPEGFTHGNVERISAINTALHFRKDCLPNLKHFHIRFDKKGAIRQLLYSYSDLLSASLYPTKSREDFDQLPTTLRYLRLVDGSLANLAGIYRLNELTDLHLQNLPKLTVIGDVAACQKIKEVTVGYCNSIQDLGRITELKKLERFQLFASRIKNKEEVKNKFGMLNLKEVCLTI
jgi:hypothetical protein